jgi:hypothetical protein
MTCRRKSALPSGVLADALMLAFMVLLVLLPVLFAVVNLALASISFGSSSSSSLLSEHSIQFGYIQLELRIGNTHLYLSNDNGCCFVVAVPLHGFYAFP